MKPLKDWTLEEAHNYCIGYRFSHENNFRFNSPNGYTMITAWANFPNVPKWEGD